MSGGDWKELYVSAENGNLDLVKYHIYNKIDPNYIHPEIMTTPLMASIEFGHYEVAKFLLENGADPLIKELFGHHTPLSMAKKLKNKEMVNLIKGFIK
jgi:ankyrin repeat protein